MIQVVPNIAEMQSIVAGLKSAGKSIGIVPTMGFFHEGHLSLMRRSVEESDATIVTLFVNPTQFGPKEDLDAYPSDLEKDKKLADEIGVQYMFTPTKEMMYPEGYNTYVKVEEWSEKLCGMSRPVHFRGVTTICNKLFNICQPNKAYFGLKDAQQVLIIKKMIRDLNMNLEVVPLATVREEDGLAMSSRNVYMTPEERVNASLINKALTNSKRLFDDGNTNASEIEAEIRKILSSAGKIRIDYIEIVDTDTLELVDEIRNGTLIAIAAYLGKARLIDNIIV